MIQAITPVTVRLEGDPVYLIPFMDIHIGSPYFREDALRGYISWIQRTNAYVIGGGDWHQNDIPNNRASNVWTQTLSPENQVDRLAEILSPIRDRLLFAVGGGHDQRFTKSTSIDLMALTWGRLGLPTETYGPTAVFATIYVNKVKYLVYLTHGWGGARNSGGQVNKIEELCKAANADLFLTGHEHTLTYSRRNYRVMAGKTIRNQRQIFVGCGGFEDYTPFLVGIGRRPPDIGCPRIRFDGQRKDIHVSF